jgi:UDP-N-acetylglucosamine--N-acetylmuramyl-(pentapeptide) pyrophosphoryl-undecaprenol N-acetylglucosamine transferase
LPRGVRSIVTGNPVRHEIARLAVEPRLPGDGPRTLLILGGSQGARHLNVAVLAALRQLRDDTAGWRIVHQAGQGHDADLREGYRLLGLNATITPFLADMAAEYRNADMAVCRAGATTLAELACARLPAILVPYPHAARNHQQHNADVFVRAGAALQVREQPLPDDTGSLLAQSMRRLLDGDALRERMAAALKPLARPDAAEAVLAQLAALRGLAAA